MSGHIHAAIVSMRARYRRLKLTGDMEGAQRYLVSDPDDTSRYYATNEQRDTMFNPCMNSTYAFVEHIVHAIIDMHKVRFVLRCYWRAQK